jgi:hypothetical protein
LSWPSTAITYNVEGFAAEFIADTMIPAYCPVKTIEVQAVVDTI